jgi:hypothetical protein
VSEQQAIPREPPRPMSAPILPQSTRTLDVALVFGWMMAGISALNVSVGLSDLNIGWMAPWAVMGAVSAWIAARSRRARNGVRGVWRDGELVDVIVKKSFASWTYSYYVVVEYGSAAGTAIFRHQQAPGTKLPALVRGEWACVLEPGVGRLRVVRLHRQS